jgi:hypothetical protein
LKIKERRSLFSVVFYTKWQFYGKLGVKGRFSPLCSAHFGRLSVAVVLCRYDRQYQHNITRHCQPKKTQHIMINPEKGIPGGAGKRRRSRQPPRATRRPSPCRQMKPAPLGGVPRPDGIPYDRAGWHTMERARAYRGRGISAGGKRGAGGAAEGGAPRGAHRKRPENRKCGEPARPGLLYRGERNAPQRREESQPPNAGDAVKAPPGAGRSNAAHVSGYRSRGKETLTLTTSMIGKALPHVVHLCSINKMGFSSLGWLLMCSMDYLIIVTVFRQ